MKREGADTLAVALLIAAILGGCFGVFEVRLPVAQAPFHYPDWSSIARASAISMLIHGLALAVIVLLVAPLLRRFAPFGAAAAGASVGGTLLISFVAQIAQRGTSLRSLFGVSAIAGALLLSIFGAWIAWQVARPLLRRAGRSGAVATLLAGSALLAVILALPEKTATGKVSYPVGGEPATSSGQSVLLITLDTTRPDFLGCYGNPAVRSPNIDRLAAAGTLFSTTTAAIPVTLPSHLSLFTGKYPFRLGVTDNGQLFQGESSTLAENFRNLGGANTAAVVAAFPLDEWFGAGRGFDTYDDDTDPAGFGNEVRRLVSYVSIGKILERAHLSIRTDRIAERAAGEITESAIHWLEANGGEHFFLWVHYYDPHAPYEPPQRYRESYRDAHGLGSNDLDAVDIEIPGHARMAGASDLSDYREAYAGEISFTDAEVGRLLEAAEDNAGGGPVLVVLTADHGEGLGNHGVMTHTSRVYEEQLRVPLIISWIGGSEAPDGTNVGRDAPPVFERPVRVIDIAPTMAELAGLPSLAGSDGSSFGAFLNPERSVSFVGETWHDEFFVEAPGGGGIAGFRSGRWKLIRSLSSGDEELYDLASDPRERRNVAGDQMDIAADLAEALDLLLAARAAETSGDGAKALPEAAREKLRALGYVGDD